ncbi:ATP-dependent DNA helicase [Acetivibrio cellulolyticus]|uniref:ATP-dependent DNA helicase n=1 Tax=Acetivibrio cellulolyticus TaxID=35830 RepID=UPI0001E2D41C|nr:ATP-dependent DNA helicase [Acetivibrio cellulolyticus]
MNMDKKEIKVSVRNLVEFLLREGDIDSSFFRVNRAVEGTRIHKKIQKSQKEDYRPEVTLKYNVEYEEFVLSIEGRADGIIEDSNGVVIDEIKSTMSPLETIDENYSKVHWAQAKCYAYIYATLNNIEEINVRLTYCHLDTEEIKYLVRTFTILQLKEFFDGLIQTYYSWAKLVYDWQEEREQSIKNMKFPFEVYRKGQRELAVAVYKTITSSKNIFVKAPTGTGKTISTLFPAIKAMGEGHTSKIFYLTAKTITRSVAEEAFSIMRSKGLKFKTVTLTAKEKICIKEKPSCNPIDCEFAKGHFDRINDAVMDILTHENELKRDTIEMYSRKHRVCPFEYSLDLTLWADAVICDYNYVFDPRVYLKRFFTEKGDYTFLVDEAHNLVDRAREMYSAELYKKPVLKMKNEMKELSPKISKVLGRLNIFMLNMKKLCNEKGFYVSSEGDKDIYSILRKFVSECEEYLAKNENTKMGDELLELYFDALICIKICELYDERYVTYIEKQGDDVKLKLFCLDPAYLLGEALKKGKCGIFFSATLIPLDYYRGILGGNTDDYTMSIESPFSVDNRKLLVADSISTRYINRERSYKHIVESIRNLTHCKCGNYLIFFPSYQYMNNVYDVFCKEYPDVKVHVQSNIMTEEERENFLGFFIPDPSETTIGFCVMGGIFSEGIDLKSDRLIGTVIVGVGLPQVCLERDIIRDYFQERNSQGFEFAYMFPGMNKVMQAAGRVIRSETDKGIILLIDERFTNRSYLNLFPKEWFPYARVVKTNDIIKYVTEFWREEI